MARSQKESIPHSNDERQLQQHRETVETSEAQLTLSDLPIGARLLIRSRTDWRTAAIARFVEETEIVVLTVRSPSGYSYRLRRDRATQVMFDGGFPVLPADADDTWRDNFSHYDGRW